MMFVCYPTTGDRKAMRNGRLVEGQPISPAPPSGHWVLCPSEPADKRFHRVFGAKMHGGKLLQSSIESECRK